MWKFVESLLGNINKDKLKFFNVPNKLKDTCNQANISVKTLEVDANNCINAPNYNNMILCNQNKTKKKEVLILF